MRLNLAWRLVAIAALGLYAALVFAAVRLLAHNLGFALLFALTAPIVVYAVWLLFSGEGNRKRNGWWWLGVGLLALVVELGWFMSEPGNGRAVIALLLLSVLYLGVLAVLRRNYWREARRLGEAVRETAQFRRPYLIVNPKSGNGRALKAHIPELARRQGIEVVTTQKGEDVESIARRAATAGADVLGISGGDGSIGAVAKVAIEHDLPIVVLPGGTRCHFARDLGLEPKRIADALAGFTGVERRIDAADINGRIFLNNASFGLYADIVDDPDYREHKLEVSRNVLRALANGDKPLYDLQFRYRGRLVSRAAQVLIGVNRYQTLNIFELGHRERLDEGILQVTVVARLNDAVIKELLRAVSIDWLGRRPALSDIYQWGARSFVISAAANELVVGVDGEREVYATPVTITIHPRALRVYVPAEGERNRAKNPFSTDIVRRVWHGAAGRPVRS